MENRKDTEHVLYLAAERGDKPALGSLIEAAFLSQKEKQKKACRWLFSLGTHTENALTDAERGLCLWIAGECGCSEAWLVLSYAAREGKCGMKKDSCAAGEYALRAAETGGGYMKRCFRQALAEGAVSLPPGSEQRASAVLSGESGHQ